MKCPWKKTCCFHSPACSWLLGLLIITMTMAVIFAMIMMVVALLNLVNLQASNTHWVCLRKLQTNKKSIYTNDFWIFGGFLVFWKTWVCDQNPSGRRGSLTDWPRSYYWQPTTPEAPIFSGRVKRFLFFPSLKDGFKGEGCSKVFFCWKTTCKLFDGRFFLDVFFRRCSSDP